jgi:sec-independent protein translocase protein TatA
MPIGGPELIIILVVVLIIFGPSRLPKLGESLGKTMRSLREGMDGKSDDESKPKAKAKAKKPVLEAEEADDTAVDETAAAETTDSESE